MKRVDKAEHHTGKGQKGSKIIALPKQSNRVVYLAGSLTAYAFKKKDSEKKRKPGCGECKGSPAPGTHTRCSRKALALKDYLHSVSKAGWLLAAQREKSSYGVNAHKPYCFLRCSHALRNHDSEIQWN